MPFQYIPGLNIGHDPSAALLDYNGAVLAAAHESRLSRNNKERRFPDRAIGSVLKVSGISASAVDVVAYSNYEADTIWNVRDKYLCGEGSLEATPEQLLEEKLRAHGLERFCLERQDHHFSHACTAYFAADDPEALVVTCDGFGDGLSFTVRRPKNGRLTQETLWQLPVCASFGLPYQYVTGGLGFSMLSEEWKLLGLEQSGKPEKVRVLFNDLFSHAGEVLSWNVDKLTHALSVEHDGKIPLSDSALMHALSLYLECMVPCFLPSDVSAGVQDLLEALVVRQLSKFVGNQPTSLALAGGVFLNVKLNRVLAELPWVKSVSVFPAAGDGGSAVGAALAHLHCYCPSPPIGALEHVFWGQSYEPEVGPLCSSLNLRTPALSEDESVVRVSDAVAAGRIVAVCRGRSEFGPRALLHRSLLCRTDRLDLVKTLNARLLRESFMPYGCTLLEAEAERYLEQTEPLRQCLRFMIAATRVKPEFYERHAAVCHPIRGGGASTRPQIIANDGSWEARLLLSVQQKTGFAGVLNTSFNLHGEPIVETPKDAVTSFKTAQIPGSLLLLEDRLLSIDDLVSESVPELRSYRPIALPRRRQEACVCIVPPSAKEVLLQFRAHICSFGYKIASEISIPSSDVWARCCDAEIGLEWSSETEDFEAFLVIGTRATEVVNSWVRQKGNPWSGVWAADNGMETCVSLRDLFSGKNNARHGIFADLLIHADGEDLPCVITELAENTSLSLAGLIYQPSEVHVLEKVRPPTSAHGVALVYGASTFAPAPLHGKVFLYSPDGPSGLVRRIREVEPALNQGDFRFCRTRGLIAVYESDPARPFEEQAVLDSLTKWGVDGIVVAAPNIDVASGRNLCSFARKYGLAMIGGTHMESKGAGTFGVQSGGLTRFINRFPGIEL